MYKIKLHKTSKCLWPVYIDMFVVKWMFFLCFQNHFPKIHRNVLHKVTTDLLYCIFETLLHRNNTQARLWFARLLFKNSKKIDKRFNDRVYVFIIFLNEHPLEAVVLRCSGVLKISKNLQWKIFACGLQLYIKNNLCYRCLNFVKLLSTLFLINRTPPVVASGLFF